MVPFNVNKDSKKIGKEHTRGENNQEFHITTRKLTRKKHFSKHLAFGLFYAHQDEGKKSPLWKNYIKTIYCGEELMPVTNEDGKRRLASKRCEGRWCPRCQSIRIAKMIQGYGPQIGKLTEPYFVTLTAPTVTEEELPDQMKAFQARWRAITKDRYWRKNKPKGIRKVECTIRPEGKYHYHWHIIIDGKKHAEWIVAQWLQRCPEASGLAQDIRPVRQGEYLEIFKYFTKLIAQDKSTGKRFIDFKRLDAVMVAMRGKRVYQPFGGLKRVQEDNLEDDLQSVEVPKDYHALWKWATGIGYVNEETGEVLTGDYELPKWVEALTGSISDEKSEEVESIKRATKVII